MNIIWPTDEEVKDILSKAPMKVFGSGVRKHSWVNIQKGVPVRIALFEYGGKMDGDYQMFCYLQEDLELVPDKLRG